MKYQDRKSINIVSRSILPNPKENNLNKYVKSKITKKKITPRKFQTENLLSNGKTKSSKTSNERKQLSYS